MEIRKNIPNAITCCNLFCGCLGLIFALNGGDRFYFASYLIFAAAIFDFLDGFAARLLDVKSEMGKQLDSLADVVSFGVLPGFIMFELIERAFYNAQIDSRHLQFVALLIPIFSAIRLAKFNIDTRQTDSFIGLPTPANAILIASFPLIIFQAFDWNLLPFQSFILKTVLNPYFLISTSILSSLLLVSNLQLISLKFKTFGWAANKLKYLFLIISTLSLFLLHFLAIPLILIFYILVSFAGNRSKKTT